MPVNVRREIATAPIGAYHVWLACLVGLIVFFEGYDTFNAAYVIHYVAGPWQLTARQSGFLVSSALIGFTLGALVQGKLSIDTAGAPRCSPRCGSPRCAAC